MLDINRQDTICAAATPIAPAALGIIRISGSLAEEIKSKIFKAKFGSQKEFVATLGDLFCPRSGDLLDEVVCTFFPHGKSYTGESSLEFSVHGNPLIIKRILEVLQQNGCRLAMPGEFTLRAVLTGKIDLCAAEAVGDFIHARSTQAAAVALRGLKGGLQQELNPVRIFIIDALAEIEARLDFPDEELGFAIVEEISQKLCLAQEKLAKLLQSAQVGQRLIDGARVVFYGEPNVGKSTLLNRLLQEERALVHELPGTTRDVIEATWILDGIALTLVDVAGIRMGDDVDPIELLGIHKAQKEFERADVIVWLKVPGDDALAAPQIECGATPILSVFTKADLRPEISAETNHELHISAKNDLGIAEFKGALSRLLLAETAALDEVLITKMRQKEEVHVAAESLACASTALAASCPHEIVASELRCAGAALDRLLGKSLGEDILDLIFSRFCIGK